MNTYRRWLIPAILSLLALAALLLGYQSLARAGFLVPPERIGVQPDFEVHTAPVDASISVTFDQDMDPATVNPQTFAVHARQTGWLTKTLSVSGGTIGLDPLSPLFGVSEGLGSEQATES